MSATETQNASALPAAMPNAETVAEAMKASEVANAATQQSGTTQNIGDGKEPLNLDKEFKFSFKKQKVKNEKGEEVARPPVTLTVPVPSYNGFVDAFLNDPKVAPYILELVEDQIKDQIRVQLTDEVKPVNSQGELDLSKLTLSFIASMPKYERAGTNISKETWEEWEKDYTAVMVPLREEAGDQDATARIGRQLKLFTSKFNLVRTDKAVINFLQGQLGIWATKTNPTQLDEFGELFRFLDERASALLNKQDQTSLAAL